MQQLKSMVKNTLSKCHHFVTIVTVRSVVVLKHTYWIEGYFLLPKINNLFTYLFTRYHLYQFHCYRRPYLQMQKTKLTACQSESNLWPPKCVLTTKPKCMVLCFLILHDNLYIKIYIVIKEY